MFIFVNISMQKDEKINFSIYWCPNLNGNVRQI